MNAYSPKRSPRLPSRTIAMSGFSLIEMMISITIGLMVIAALVAVLVSNSGSAKTNDRTSELQSNGRYALDHLKRELRHAGYRGYSWEKPTPPTTAIAVTNECLDGGAADTFVQNIGQGVWGANDSNPYTLNCLPDANRVRGDVLVIRRVASQISTALTPGSLYLRSTYSVAEVFQPTASAVVAPVIVGLPIADFALQEYVYYIGKDDVDTSVPALRRIALLADGSMSDQLVVSGIEHMQLQYGRVTTDGNTQYYNANAIVGTSTTAQTDWKEVNSVRIWLLARNAKAEAGYSNTTKYPMGDVLTYPATSDSFRRQLFTAVVQLRN